MILSMIKKSPNKSHFIPSSQNLSHLRRTSSRNPFTSESHDPLPNLLDCATSSLLHQILPPAMDYVTSRGLDLVLHPSTTVISRLCSEIDHSHIPIACSKISHWVHSHLMNRFSQLLFMHPSYLPFSIYRSMDLIVTPSLTPAKVLVRASSQQRHSLESDRSHLELGPSSSTAVNTVTLYFSINFPSNCWLIWLSQHSPSLHSASPSSSSFPPHLVPSLFKHLPFLIVILSPGNRPSLHHQHTGLPTKLGEMADQQDQQGTQEPVNNPLENVITNSECSLCKAHTFMIGRFIKRFNDLKDDYQANSRSKRKKLEKHKEEIEGLKDKCSHLEAAIEHMRSLTQSMQAQASTRISARKDSISDDSVNQKLP